MQEIYILCGVILLLMGMIYLFNQETAWRLAQWSNTMRGRKSERTANREAATTLQGLLAIFLSLFLFWMAYTASVEEARKQEWPGSGFSDSPHLTK